MVDIYKGCKFDDLYIESDVAINKAVLYNISANTSKEFTLTLRQGTTYTYDMLLTTTVTKSMPVGIYALELLDADSRMLMCDSTFARVIQSSKQNA